MRRALFLDRDGVINIDYGYVYKKECFKFIDGIFDLVKKARKLGYLIIVVTNQAGIGRGYYTEDVFWELTEWMKSQFKLHDAEIDHVYFCPDHPQHGIGRYLKESPMRKPAPGMLLRARDEFGIEMNHSILVGDNRTDMEAGSSAGVGTLLWLNPKELEGPGEPVYSLDEVTFRLTPATT